MSLEHWFLRFGVTSRELWLIVADFAECLRNGHPPWAAYQAITSSRMIALDKQPGFSPVRVRETWWRQMAKFLLHVTGQEAKAACGTEQLVGVIEAWIEGVIHSMRLIWEQHSQEEDWRIPPHRCV